MIYEGKEYKEVTDGSAEIGDLIHVTEVKGIYFDAWCFTTDRSFRLPGVDVLLPDGCDCLYMDEDIFTRYRYVEETPVPKEKNVPLAHANKIQELVQRAATTPASLADIISAAQRRALKGTPNDAIDAMRYGFENLGKTLERPTLSDNVNDLFTEIKDIIVSKNENYGDSFSRQYQKYGMVSVEMRLNDKFMRLEQLVAGEKDKVGESIEDTLKDIIGYATLALIELEREKGDN